VPKLVADAGKRFANFFGSIENDNTRSAYQRACMLFFAWWCHSHDLALADIERSMSALMSEPWERNSRSRPFQRHLAASIDTGRSRRWSLQTAHGTEGEASPLTGSAQFAAAWLFFFSAGLGPDPLRRMMD
jgi:hypothetical protein